MKKVTILGLVMLIAAAVLGFLTLQKQYNVTKLVKEHGKPDIIEYINQDQQIFKYNYSFSMQITNEKPAMKKCSIKYIINKGLIKNTNIKKTCDVFYLTNKEDITRSSQLDKREQQGLKNKKILSKKFNIEL